ncbi:carbonic anhydrase/acetyltransferase-like protein (isoleucine patch superfamily) [Elusimicrobium simillimum]|uniref:gamma carbonic anhydrase family protein n=1 Tax=Elusimicrobium simillimum TaxID=3143438 RepID=UPI003C6F7E99
MKERIKDLMPVTAPTAYIHKTAVIIGNVKIGENVSIWPCAVLRGDIAGITIADNANVQDNAVIHVNHDRPAIIGKGTTLGHGVVVHGSEIGANCLIGMNAVVLESEIGDNCIIGAGSVLTAGKKIPPGSLVMGTPAKIIRQLTEDEVNGIMKNGAEYVQLKELYKQHAEEV